MSNRRSRSRRREKILGLDNKTFYISFIVLIFIILICVGVIVYKDFYEQQKVAAEKERINSEVEDIFKSADEEFSSLNDYKANTLFRFSAVGDILCGNNLQKYTRDYNEIFTNVKKYVSDSDYVLGTYETNVQDESFLKSIKNAGINVVSLAHNHALDNGIDGLAKINNSLESIGLKTVGISSDNVEERVKIFEKGEAKVAVLAYTYDNKKEGVNIFSEELAKQDLEYTKKNANATIVMMHWGNVNTNEISKEQEQQAEFLINNGADVIIGAHPSAVQKMEVKQNSNGKDCFVAYSIGDFTSDFESENANLELILNFQIYVDKDGNTTLYKVDYTPVYMIDWGVKAENRYQILDLKKEIANYQTEESNIDKRTYEKLVRGIERLKNIVKK